MHLIDFSSSELIFCASAAACLTVSSAKFSVLSLCFYYTFAKSILPVSSKIAIAFFMAAKGLVSDLSIRTILILIKSFFLSKSLGRM